MCEDPFNPPDPSLLIKLFEVIALFLAAVTPNRRHIEHAVPELDERAALDGNIQISDVMQAEVDELLRAQCPIS